jgi:subtilisin family serine protease
MLALVAGPAMASDFSLHYDGLGLKAKTSSVPKVQSWMHSEIGDAWAQGYRGKGVTITVVDDFRSNFGYYGDLGLGLTVQRHGEWTRQQAQMLAPQATMRSRDFTSGKTVPLNKGLNVLNLSYGMFAAAGYTSSQISWSAQESSIISYAHGGRAVIAKAAGNDGVAVGAANAAGVQDYLNSALIGAQSAIFVGALGRNGTTDNQASLAWYSNYAGSDTAVQDNFIVVGVEGHKTGLYGTSFAAPIVSGYSAVLGSKFRKAKPTQITNQLLSTARTDTIKGYDPALHGRGEASIARALAPQAIR